MRVLLIQAVSACEGAEIVFPLGLARLAAVLGDRHEVKGLDLNLNPFPWTELLKTLQEFDPQIICISFRNLDPLAERLTSFVPQLRTLATLARKYAPQATMLLGGPGFTLCAKRLMEEIPEIDLGVRGEADDSLPELLRNVRSPWSVPGILWRGQNGSIEESPARARCLDLDALPFPRWEAFDPRRYMGANRYVAFMGVETKRGCPNRCSYCLYPKIQGSQLRLRSPEKVVDELEFLHEAFDIKLVHFTDPVINQPADHLRAICSEILRRNLKMNWTGFFREDVISENDIDLYRDAGLATWYYSADGASRHALELLEKNLTPDQILNAARLAAASGIVTVYHFLVNLPGETRSTVDETRALLDKILDFHSAKGNPGALVISNLRVYPGARLTDFLLKKGLLAQGYDLLYPTYYNPPPWDNLRHDLKAYYMQRSVFDYLESGEKQLQVEQCG